jgi:hypothetical protein
MIHPAYLPCPLPLTPCPIGLGATIEKQPISPLSRIEHDIGTIEQRLISFVAFNGALSGHAQWLRF